MTESQRRAREIMTAVVHEDYGLARTLLADVVRQGPGLSLELMETVLMLNRIVLLFWAMQNDRPLAEFWVEFSLFLEQQGWRE